MCTICLQDPFTDEGWYESVYQNCYNKYTSLTSQILFASIRIVVVHGGMSVSYTFALYLHVSSNFFQAYYGLVFIFSNFREILSTSVLQSVHFCCIFYDSYTPRLLGFCYFKTWYVFHQYVWFGSV